MKIEIEPSDDGVASVTGGVVPRLVASVEADENGSEPVGDAALLELRLQDATPRIVVYTGRFNPSTGELDNSQPYRAKQTCTACGWFELAGSFTQLQGLVLQKCDERPANPECPVVKLIEHRKANGYECDPNTGKTRRAR